MAGEPTLLPQDHRELLLLETCSHVRYHRVEECLSVGRGFYRGLGSWDSPCMGP